MTGRVVRRPLPDVKPVTPVSRLDRNRYVDSSARVAIDAVAAVVGMSQVFDGRSAGTGHSSTLGTPDPDPECTPSGVTVDSSAGQLEQATLWHTQDAHSARRR